VEVLDIGRTSRWSRFVTAFQRDAALQQLFLSPHLPRLHALNLEGHGVEGPAMQTLIDTGLLGRLRHLDLRGNHALGDPAARLLGGAKSGQLESLNLQATNITGHGVRSFLAGATRFPRLRTLLLELSRMFALPGAVRMHLAELPSFPVVRQWRSLSLRGILLGGPSLLGPLLAALPPVRALGPGHCVLGSAGMTALAGMAALAELRTLYLPENNLRDAGARALADSPLFGSLNVLDLSGNSIGGPGLRALATSGKLGRLETLNLGAN